MIVVASPKQVEALTLSRLPRYVPPANSSGLVSRLIVSAFLPVEEEGPAPDIGDQFSCATGAGELVIPQNVFRSG